LADKGVVLADRKGKMADRDSKMADREGNLFFKARKLPKMLLNNQKKVI
jgi:hypothetical protein